jgi:hypothetical protein
LIEQAGHTATQKEERLVEREGWEANKTTEIKAWTTAIYSDCEVPGSNISMNVNLNRHNASNAVMEKTMFVDNASGFII